MQAKTPSDELARAGALAIYRILDTPPEAAFDRIVRLAAETLEMPVAAISFVEGEREWFKATLGFPLTQIPREFSFCAHAILQKDEEVLVVPDVSMDPRFKGNPYVEVEGGARFYAGAVLREPGGQAIGTLCVSDSQPRNFSERDRRILRGLAALVIDELTLRVEIHAREQAETHLRIQHENLRCLHVSIEQHVQARTLELTTLNHALHAEVRQRKLANNERGRSERRFRQLFNQASDTALVHDIDGRFIDVNDAACTSLGYTRDELLKLGVPDIETMHTPEGLRFWRELAVGGTERFEGVHRRKDGSVFPVEVHVSVLDTADGRQLLALVRDVTEHKKAEKTLRVRAREQAAIAQLGTLALCDGNVDSLFREAVRLVSETLEVEVCRVLEALPEQAAFVTRAGLHHSPVREGTILDGDQAAFAHHVLRTAQAVIMDEIEGETRFKLPPDLQATGVQSGLCVVIGGTAPDAKRFGVLAVATTKRRAFTEDDLFFVQSVANALAAAIVRQHHEEERRIVEARYHRIAANTPGVVYQYLLRPDGTVAVPFISEGCRLLHGREPEDIQHDPQLMVDSVHPEDRAEFIEALRTAETHATPLQWQGRHLLPDEKIRWVKLDSRPERLPDGSVIHDGIIIDMTAEIERKEALRQSEQRFRLAILHSPFPIMLHADDGEILQVNHAWTHMTGYAAEELTTLDEWIRRAYPNREKEKEVRQFLADLTDYVGAVEATGRHVRCASGEERIWDISCANLGRLPDGRWLRISTAADVTESRRTESALRVAKDEAERASNAKSEFLSRISHELRTPLNAILGFGQILELGALDAQGAESVGHILKAGRHLLGLIDEVLDLSRAETGELHLLPGHVDVNQLTRECAGLVARLAQTRGITCRVKAQRQHPSLWTDEQRLRQTLLNLLSNAIKYNQPGGQVLLSVEKMPSGRLRISVSDTGPGISPEGIKRLFVPFERLGQEHGEVEGTGLGLVVSQRLAEAMGGQLGVESTVGYGSTFWIELPLGAPAATVPKVAAPPEPHPTVATAATPSATLLYIEDNASNLQVVKMLLAKRRPHWRFLAATEGISGLEQARREMPDLILLDLQLPGIPGDRVLAELRGDPRTRHMPIIMLSADANTHSRERLLANGADEYISKPFKLDHLLDLLDANLLKPAVAQQHH